MKCEFILDLSIVLNLKNEKSTDMVLALFLNVLVPFGARTECEKGNWVFVIFWNACKVRSESS